MFHQCLCVIDRSTNRCTKDCSYFSMKVKQRINNKRDLCLTIIGKKKFVASLRREHPRPVIFTYANIIPYISLCRETIRQKTIAFNDNDNSITNTITEVTKIRTSINMSACYNRAIVCGRVPPRVYSVTNYVDIIHASSRPMLLSELLRNKYICCCHGLEMSLTHSSKCDEDSPHITVKELMWRIPTCNTRLIIDGMINLNEFRKLMDAQ